MSAQTSIRSAAGWLSLGVGVAAATYGAYAARTWHRYGQAEPPAFEERDGLLDQFMPVYDVVERHCVRVNAPAAVTLAAACDMDLQESAIVRLVIKARELLLGATSVDRVARGLLAEMRSLGWGVLADVPGREIVVGAVTKPWEANVTFRSVPPDQFAAFSESDYVKISWTLRVDSVSATESILRTETRAIATDSQARTKFRWYWTFLSPGIRLIRWASFGPAKREAERRATSA